MSPEQIFPHHKLFYLDEQPNSLQPVMFLHGLGANSASWALQIPAFVQAGFRVIAPDTRGFGQSTYPGRTSVSLMVEDFLSLLDALKIESTDVVGLSMGGAQALQMAINHPERVRRLVLANTFASLRPSSPNVWTYFLLRLVLIHLVGLKKQAQYVANRVFPQVDQEMLRQELVHQVLQASPAGYRATMRALGMMDLSQRLREIRAPTLVITGERDTTVPADVQAVLAQRIPGARQEIVAGAGHAVSVEKYAQFNQLLLAFLSER